MGLARVDEPVIPQEEKKEALDPMEEPVDPHAAAPARSMHQAPHCSVPVIWQSSRPASSSSSSYKFVAPRSKAPGVDASRPTGSKSSSDKFVAPSSKAHGDYQGVDASQPTGSQSSSHDASQPAAHKEEKIDAAEFDTWDKEHQRCAALLGRSGAEVDRAPRSGRMTGATTGPTMAGTGDEKPTVLFLRRSIAVSHS